MSLKVHLILSWLVNTNTLKLYFENWMRCVWPCWKVETNVVNTILYQPVQSVFTVPTCRAVLHSNPAFRTTWNTGHFGSYRLKLLYQAEIFMGRSGSHSWTFDGSRCASGPSSSRIASGSPCVMPLSLSRIWLARSPFVSRIAGNWIWRCLSRWDSGNWKGKKNKNAALLSLFLSLSLSSLSLSLSMEWKKSKKIKILRLLLAGILGKEKKLKSRSF